MESEDGRTESGGKAEKKEREREGVAMSCMLMASRPPFFPLCRLCVFSVPPLSRLDFSSLSLSLSESVSSRHDFNFAPHCAKVSRIACSRDAIEISERKEGLGTRSQAAGSYMIVHVNDKNGA